MKCGICLADNAPGSVFCSDCGTMLTPATTMTATSLSGSGANVGSGSTVASGGRPNRALVVTSAIAIVASLALAALLVFLAVDDDNEPSGFDSSATTLVPTLDTTIVPNDSTTVAPSDTGDSVGAATTAWQSASATYLQAHTDVPFSSGGRSYAIASVDDVAGRKNDSGAIDGLVLLGWRDDAWTPVDGLPWTSPAGDVTFEVLGDRLVDAPMVSISWCCETERATTRVFRLIDGVATDVVSGRPIDDEWTAIDLTDRSFDFLEYTTCKAGEVIEVADGVEAFFCDVTTSSRLEIADDGSVSVSSTDTNNVRPVVIRENDLGIDGVVMSQPECSGAYITAVGASVSRYEARNRANVARLLARYPGSHYLRTDQTCDSLWPSIGGAPVYVVYFGPFDTKAEACAARSKGPSDSYVRPLSDSISHHTRVYC